MIRHVPFCIGSKPSLAWTLKVAMTRPPNEALGHHWGSDPQAEVGSQGFLLQIHEQTYNYSFFQGLFLWYGLYNIIMASISYLGTEVMLTNLSN